MYFFSNSPVKWRLTKVVYHHVSCYCDIEKCAVTVNLMAIWTTKANSNYTLRRSSRHTFPVPPSPTRTSLKVGTADAASAMIVDVCGLDEKRGKQGRVDLRGYDKMVSVRFCRGRRFSKGPKF